MKKNAAMKSIEPKKNESAQLISEIAYVLFNSVEKAVLVQLNRKSRPHLTHEKKPSSFNPLVKAVLIQLMRKSCLYSTQSKSCFHST